MIQSRWGLLPRAVLACLLGSAGIALGWTLSRSEPKLLNWLLPLGTLVSASLLGVEVAVCVPRRRFWVVPLCLVLAGRAAYDILRLLGGTGW